MSLHFLDIGANIGQTFTDYLRQNRQFDGCEVWCFEPSPRHVPALMQTAQMWQHSYKIHICPFGLRGHNEITRFYMKDDPRGDSFAVNLASDHKTENLQTGYILEGYAHGLVEFLVDKTQPGDKVVIKIDAEGSEYSILTELACQLQGDPEMLARIDRIMVEWHTIDADAECWDQGKLADEFDRLGKPLERWMF